MSKGTYGEPKVFSYEEPIFQHPPAKGIFSWKKEEGKMHLKSIKHESVSANFTRDNLQRRYKNFFENVQKTNIS